MRKLFLFIGFILVLFSCQKENEIKNVNSDFSIGDTILRVNENLAITNLSDSGTVIYDWDFGDGFTSNEKNPVHNYASPGSYIVKLKVSDRNGNTDISEHAVRVGERFVYEIIVNSLSQQKWFSSFGNWDEDSTGIKALPDVFMTIKEFNGLSLYESEILYNVDVKRLPLTFKVPEIKIENSNVGIGSTGIYLNDNDGSITEEMASNYMSGASCSNDNYNKPEHKGEFTINFFSEYTVKYKIE